MISTVHIICLITLYYGQSGTIGENTQCDTSGKPRPLHVRLRLINSHKDAPGMDFADAEATEATQLFDVVEGREGVEYQVK